jgi:serine/threonine-protein kinase TNNI3K
VNNSLEGLLAKASPSQKLPEAFARQLVKDVAAGISYLHSLKPALIHRMLSTRKVLLDGDMRAIITDFTLSASRETKGPDFARMTKIVDPPNVQKPVAPWAAPELLAKRPYSLPVDVYSWGVVVQHIAAASSGTIAEMSLIDDCLRPQANERPTADEVLGRCLAYGPYELSQSQWGIYQHEAVRREER